MKKLIIVLIAALTLMTACSTGGDNGGAGSGEGKEDVVSNFKAYTAEAENPSEVKDRLDSLLESTDKETSDSLIQEYLKYLDKVMSEDTVYEKDVMEEAGFKLISVEGDEQPIIDYHFIDAYSDKISQEMNDFKEFMVLNSDQPWAKDGGLIISLEDLADRIALGEKFLINYPESSLKEQVKIQYRYYLISLLGGLDNTSLVDYATNEIDKDFISAFEYFQETYPNLKTTDTVTAFYNELEAAGFATPYSYGEYEKRDEFRRHLEQLASDAESRLEP